MMTRLPILPKIEPLIMSKRQILPQISQRGRSFKFQFIFSNTIRSAIHFRRKSCMCEECGRISCYQQKQNALVPVTYIRAHHIKKLKRKMHRNKGLNGRQLSVFIERRPTKVEDIQYLIPSRKERKTKTLLQNQLIEQTLLKCKRLLTKDDSSIKYESFFQNELRLACNQTKEFRTTSTFEKTLTQVNQKYPGVSQYTINESQVASMQNVNESQILILKLPQVTNKIKQKTSLHSPRVYQDIIHGYNLQPNKTVEKYISSSTHCSPKRANIKLPQIKQLSQRKKFDHTYSRGSPLKLLLELKSQILLQKKMSKQ